MDAFGWWILMNLSNTNDMSSAPKIIHVQNDQFYMKVTNSVIHLIPEHYLLLGQAIRNVAPYVIYETLIRQRLLKCPPEKCLVKMSQCKGNFRTLLINFWDTHASYMYSTVKWSLLQRANFTIVFELPGPALWPYPVGYDGVHWQTPTSPANHQRWARILHRL